MTVDSKIAAAAGKAPLHLLPLRWLVGLARVFEFGRKKHGRENYYASDNDPDECERYMGAVLRHLSAMQTPGGSYTPASCAATDDESGIPHLDHAIAGLVMLRARMCKAGALPEDPGPQMGDMYEWTRFAEAVRIAHSKGQLGAWVRRDKTVRTKRDEGGLWYLLRDLVAADARRNLRRRRRQGRMVQP